MNGSSSAHQGHHDFTANIAASAIVDLVNPSDAVDDSAGSSGTTPHVIHAVSVSQPMQTWNVIRDHIDFTTMDAALKNVAPGLPNCPGLPNITHTSPDGNIDVNFIVQARNAAQEWLAAALTLPAVRNSAIMRQFLCYGANIVPPQFEGVGWVNFNLSEEQHAAHQHAQHSPHHPAPTSYAAAVRGGGQNLDEMEMDEMFAFEGEHENDDSTNADEDDDSYDGINGDDDASYLQGRYEPTDELPEREEVMDFQKDIGEVEMVEDVGSLAQSLGASHLGRSLNLQKEMMSYKKGQQMMQQQQQQGLPMGGVNIMSTVNSMAEGVASGGIGNAMEQAKDLPQAQPEPHIQGLADSFYRTSPISAPKLDSFKMVKVIGKGSFGKI